MHCTWSSAVHFSVFQQLGLRTVVFWGLTRNWREGTLVRHVFAHSILVCRPWPIARQEGSQSELARRFGVSFEYVRKIRKHWRRDGAVWGRIRQGEHLRKRGDRASADAMRL